MQRDTQIFDLILKEQERQEHGIELIASENFVSRQVMEAAGSVRAGNQVQPHRSRRLARLTVGHCPEGGLV